MLHHLLAKAFPSIVLVNVQQIKKRNGLPEQTVPQNTHDFLFITQNIYKLISKLGDTTKYSVFIDNAIRTYFDGQIAPVGDTANYNWVDVTQFRNMMTAYQINNPSGQNLYSLNSARIDFVPYQFRPALKMIHSDEPRILIADSVGVGKTIEAGLIIKELSARQELEKVLIICPRPLVAERKWELEMKRFTEKILRPLLPKTVTAIVIIIREA